MTPRKVGSLFAARKEDVCAPDFIAFSAKQETPPDLPPTAVLPMLPKVALVQ